MHTNDDNFTQLSNGNWVNVSCILDDRLYLGGIIYNVDDLKRFIAEKNINAVVSVWDESMLNVEQLGVAREDYLYIYIHDNVVANIMQHFDSTYSFIVRKLGEGKRVYVHCHAGVSRSATIVVYFLMKHYNIGLAEAYQIVVDRRNIRPNNSFLRQLQMAESQMEF
ncbi:Tyrosine serine phosphatase 2 [Spodoptera exigua multiple nucleopolyhedrovirus]|uniref:Ptp2 n=2 Tax=Spodoptera exigua multiple nucleopolyhedrovirus TaxID=10454 RepID=W0UZM3_9ABAC|nr:ORF26 ptp2 [Spodoptera exigua multiple nucleopolyhedrovirus]AAF33556.1 ORF26 ptp2 [Spodoptera exigua multiple nucleopolyhedrovirus]QKO28903.1 ptp2 [Spodoptera exigua multiple nucleopolyhedrovirus]UWK31547.1 ptp-2 [Spodoptera exigua multiple nucleopolyhedrovirus]CDG72367.1 Tyrosine serine phosphatase 2 [Spodoptera exigua multiple nucleopolyhedrovirus]CDG72504.1 Tyrosine serine phosphatase 2 [Spodoptera exigua multiple nucleopolyhedrovirus]